MTLTASKVSKHVVTSGPYFPAFGLNTGKYGPEITPYLDTFHAVPVSLRMSVSGNQSVLDDVSIYVPLL